MSLKSLNWSPSIPEKASFEKTKLTYLFGKKYHAMFSQLVNELVLNAFDNKKRYIYNIDSKPWS